MLWQFDPQISLSHLKHNVSLDPTSGAIKWSDFVAGLTWALEVFNVMGCINLRFTYLLTYLIDELHKYCISLPQTVISDLTVTIGTFKNRLKSALYGRAFLQ